MLRSLLKIGLLLLVMGTLMLSASAQMLRVTDNDLLGTADLIIVGTIKSVTTLPYVPYWQAGQAIVTVEKVLKGAKVVEVTVRYPLPPTPPPGMVIMDGGGMSLKAGQQQLFFLQRGQEGYQIIGQYQGMRPAADAEKYSEAIRAYPLNIALVGPLGPLYFGVKQTVKVKVTNSGFESIQIDAANLEGFFISSRMGSNLSYNILRQAGGPLAGDDKLLGTPLPQTVQAGKSLEVLFTISCEAPQDWRLLSPDTYVQTPAAVRVKLFVQHANPTNGDITPSWSTASSWKTVMVGYAPPSE